MYLFGGISIEKIMPQIICKQISRQLFPSPDSVPGELNRGMIVFRLCFEITIIVKKVVMSHPFDNFFILYRPHKREYVSYFTQYRVCSLREK